jgi:hypothetical protein
MTPGALKGTSMLRVYVETSVWGMVSPEHSPALRGPTLEFLAECERRVFLPHISDVAAGELRQAPPQTLTHVLDAISRVDPIMLSMAPEAEELAQRFIDGGIVSRRRLEDARHVACAMINEQDLLVSWNYRHIANVRKAEGFNAVAVLAGLRGGLQIHTPLEVLEWR